VHLPVALCSKALNWQGAGPGPRYNVVVVRPSGQQMREMLELVQRRKLKPVIDRVLPLEQARWAGTVLGLVFCCSHVSAAGHFSLVAQ
jgi:hypothetical protein